MTLVYLLALYGKCKSCIKNFKIFKFNYRKIHFLLMFNIKGYILV